MIVYPHSRKYDKIYCVKCKEYLYLHAYQTSDLKTYCDEHLKKEQIDGSKITILVREPNSDRKYILDMFGKIHFE